MEFVKNAVSTGIQRYRTMVYGHVWDLDVRSTYPSVSQLLNIARETIDMEFARFKGISMETRMEIGINLSGGLINSVDICKKVFKAPSFDDLLDKFKQSPFISEPKDKPLYTWSRKGGYEVSSKGDKRFSAFNAIMEDGRSLECHYQLDDGYKGHDPGGVDWRLGKGKPGLDPSVNLWEAYLGLWRKWADKNMNLIEDLRIRVSAHGNVLSDMFAVTEINQARALAIILEETSDVPY